MIFAWQASKKSAKAVDEEPGAAADPDVVDDMAVLKANQSDLQVALKQQSTITVEELSSGYAVVATVTRIERP